VALYRYALPGKLRTVFPENQIKSAEIPKNIPPAEQESLPASNPSGTF
jgi:hypothetical protein